MSDTRRKIGALGLGVLAALSWATAARVSFDRGLQPVRPLYDGTTPPPTYRWVSPPGAFADGNVKPLPVTRSFELPSERSPSRSVTNDDAQASIIFSEGALVVPDGATGVEVTITPLDPVTFGEPPEGVQYGGNAYRFDAVFLPSREPLRFVSPCPEVTSCATVILRYATAGTMLLRETPQGWAQVPDPVHVSGSFQVYGNVETLGTFVAAGEPTEVERDDSFANILALGLGVLAVVGAIVASRFAPSRRRAKALQAQRKRKGSGSKGSKKRS